MKWSFLRKNKIKSELSIMYASDFGRFFNISQISKHKLNKNQYEFYLKTGGFQEYVDIRLVTKRKDESILEAELKIQRSWLNNHNEFIFGIDLIKSFISHFSQFDCDILPLIEYLWSGGESKLDNEHFMKCVQVIYNDLKKFSMKLNDQIYHFFNEEDESGAGILKIVIKKVEI